MPRIPLYYQDDEFFEDFGTSCYINHEKMVDVFPLYRHDFMEISLIVEGSGTELCKRAAFRCRRPGTSTPSTPGRTSR